MPDELLKAKSSLSRFAQFCAMRSGNDGANSYCARIRHCESYSRRSVLLRQLQGSLEVRAIRLRLATGLPFPTLIRSPARGLSARLEHTGWLVQTLSWLLKASKLAEQPAQWAALASKAFSVGAAY